MSVDSATVFQRLALIRANIEKARADVEALCAALPPIPETNDWAEEDQDLLDLLRQIENADELLDEAIDMLTPDEHFHIDRKLPQRGEEVARG